MSLFASIEEEVSSFLLSQGSVYDALVQKLMEKMTTLEQKIAFFEKENSHLKRKDQFQQQL